MDGETQPSRPFPVLPEGTITLLFTDIEGSTQLLKRLHEKYSTVLDEQREILRAAFAQWAGHVVDTRGEEFFVAFTKATDAVSAAVQAQRNLAGHKWPGEMQVRVRMGLHTGEPWIAHEGYVGMDVHRAARIGNLGHGGQVLLSETTAALVMDELPQGVSLLDLGRHRLKDVTRPEHVRQLVIEGLTADFPPLKSLEALPGEGVRDQPLHNLPAELTPFIGREHEVAKVMEQLRDPAIRLLTLLGAGGMGKTRLALHAGSDLVADFPDGVWLVEFAKLREAKLVPQHVASVFGVSATGSTEGLPVSDVLSNYLDGKKLLLLLDNCEHLIEACAELTEKLLKECPRLKVLTTSREDLGIAGEVSFVVPGLEAPTTLATPQDLDKFEATRLFFDRAKAADPGFQPTPENFTAIADICRHLDGMPLAIELAASRVNILTPDQIADLLRDRFELLTGGPRTALARHRTLQATLEWSFHLLDETEQKLFMRLSVFSGGWTMESAVELFEDDLGTRGEIIQLVSNLVDKSLVTVSRAEGTIRHGMLESVRQYAAERLSRSGEEQETRRRHAELFLRFAEVADPKIRGSEQLKWLDQLNNEHENLRAALAWSIASDQAGDAARLVGALGWFWFMRGHWDESWRWLTASLEMPSKPDPALRAKAICRAGGIQIIQGNLAEAPELVREALEVFTKLDDKEGMAWCLNLLGQATTYERQRLTAGRAYLNKSIDLFGLLGDNWGVAWSTRYLGQLAELEGDRRRALDLQEVALEHFEELGDSWNATHSLILIAGTYRDSGDYQAAERAYQDAYAKCERIGDNIMGAHALQGLGIASLELQQHRQAEEYLSSALEIMQRIGDENCAARVQGYLARVAQHDGDYDQAGALLRKSLKGYLKLKRAEEIAISLVRFAGLAGTAGHPKRAARFLGAASASESVSLPSFPPALLNEYEDQVERIRDMMDADEFEDAFEQGAVLDLESAAAHALGATQGV